MSSGVLGVKSEEERKVELETQIIRYLNTKAAQSRTDAEKHIASREGCQRITVIRAIKTLVRKGYVLERKPDPTIERENYLQGPLIELTDQGRDYASTLPVDVNPG